jgi:hypothetical protein
MNTPIFDECPAGRHSNFGWTATENASPSSSLSADPPAFGTSLKLGEQADHPFRSSFSKEGRRDQIQAFLHPPNAVSASPSTPDSLYLPKPRRPLRVLLIGERQDILTTIQNLHKRGFADAGDWSIPLPYPPQNAVSQFIPRGLSHVVISVHTKYLC